MSDLQNRVEKELEEATMRYRSASNLLTGIELRSQKGDLTEAREQETTARQLLQQWLLYAENKGVIGEIYRTAKASLGF